MNGIESFGGMAMTEQSVPAGGERMKVVTFDPSVAAKAEVVAEARLILELAERGEIVDLAWAAAHLDGSIYATFTPTDDAPRRMGAVTRLLHVLNLAMDEAAE